MPDAMVAARESKAASGTAQQVDVAVVDRFVLLSGRVPSEADRKEAERIAWQVGSVDVAWDAARTRFFDLRRAA